MASSIFRPAFMYFPPQFYPMYYPEPPVRDTGISHSEKLQRFYGNSNLKMFCLKAITQINDILYSNVIIHKIFQGNPPINMEDCFQKYFAFFLKGSNALPFLKMKYNASLGPIVRSPVFSGDFDCTLLINPDSRIPFKTAREILITELVSALLSIINEPSNWGVIRGILRECELNIQNLDVGSVDVREEALSPDDFELSEYLYNGDIVQSRRTIPGCPFQFIIHPNLHYGNNSLGLALFKLQTRTNPPVDILDISVPSQMYADLRLDWKIHSGILFRLEHSIRFFVSDFISTYIDYRIGASKNSRNIKKEKRTKLANTLRNTMIRPLLSRRMLTRKQINSLKNIPEITNYIANI